MVTDEQVKKAVSRILQRSERQEDLQKLLGTFVDVGVLPQLDNRNNQVFYGRRGTGKTHVLKVLGSRLEEDPSNVVVYIDARTLGSTAQFSDPTVPLQRRCLTLFRDVLSELHGALLEYIISNDKTEALEELDALLTSVTEPHEQRAPESVEVKKQSETESGAGVSAVLGASGPAATADLTSRRQDSIGTTETYRVSVEDKVIFPGLYAQLSKVLELADARLVCLASS